MGSCNRSFIELKVQNNQRNKLFERAWPLRLVAPLSVQALVKPALQFWREKMEGKWCDLKNKAYARCSSQLEFPVDLTRSTVLQSNKVLCIQSETCLLNNWVNQTNSA